jgi:hypothetical protein
MSSGQTVGVLEGITPENLLRTLSVIPAQSNSALLYTGPLINGIPGRFLPGLQGVCVRGLPVSPVLPHFFLSLPISWRSFPTFSNHFQPRTIFSLGDIELPIIVEGRIALHGITQLSHSGLPNMGGLVLYMVTCIYTFRTDQGSLYL